MAELTRISAQRALEALRNGVPNGDAVRALGCMQPAALDQFTARLGDLARAPVEADPPFVDGTLIAGGFGSGKSHTLAYLEQQALDRGFVVSRVVISKETPLHDPAKLFLAAVREARLPRGRGMLLHELVLRIYDIRAPLVASFQDWALHHPFGIIAASVAIHQKSHDADLLDRIVDFWAGERIKVMDLRQALKNLEMPKSFDVKPVKLALLAPVRFEFAARLARAVGFKGWVILLDEIELVARYSLLQRAKAYAALAAWLGELPGQGMRGILCVAAVTDDFALEVLDQRRDREKIPDRLKAKGEPRHMAIVAPAIAGMDVILNKAITLNPPSDNELSASYELVRNLYAVAYGAVPPNGFEPEREAHHKMRSYVRRWISTWDLERLYPSARPQAEEEKMKLDYSEDTELAAEADEGTTEPV